MKLQSQATRRFDARELRRLARASRPGAARRRLLGFAGAGLATGLLIVAIVRAAGGP